MPNNKIALITGAGSGVGRATTLTFLQDGWSVVLAGRHRETLQETADLSTVDSGRSLIVPTDVAGADSVASLFGEIKKTFGRLDLLFNNAGINVPAVPLEELSLEEWRSIIDINLTGPFLCTQQAIRLMKSQSPVGGRIVNNGSISAQSPRPHSAPYTATKHAITGLTKSTALDGRRHNIACGQIDIGNALTPMAAKMTQGVPQADGRVAIEPTIDVSRVADAVLHMANLPLDANILTMTLMATQMPLVGRG